MSELTDKQSNIPDSAGNTLHRDVKKNQEPIKKLVCSNPVLHKGQIKKYRNALRAVQTQIDPCELACIVMAYVGPNLCSVWRQKESIRLFDAPIKQLKRLNFQQVIAQAKDKLLGCDVITQKQRPFLSDTEFNRTIGILSDQECVHSWCSNLHVDHIFDAKQHREMLDRPHHTSHERAPIPITTLAIMPHNRIATGYENGAVGIFCATTGKIVHEFSTHSLTPVKHLLALPNGDVLVCLGKWHEYTNNTRMYDAKAFFEKWSGNSQGDARSYECIPLHVEIVSGGDIFFVDKKRVYLTGSSSSVIYTRNPQTGEMGSSGGLFDPITLKLKQQVTSVQVLPDNRAALGLSDCSIIIIDALKLTTITTLQDPLTSKKGSITGLKLCGNTDLISISNLGLAVAWDLTNRCVKQSLLSKIKNLAQSTEDPQNQADVKTFQEIQTQNASLWITAIEVLDDNRIVLGDWQGNIIIWENELCDACGQKLAHGQQINDNKRCVVS